MIIFTALRESDKKEIYIWDANKNDGELKCLGCNEKLIIRDGSHNIKHFAHISNSNCNYENNQDKHTYAIHILKEILEKRYVECIKRECFICGGINDSGDWNIGEIFICGGINNLNYWFINKNFNNYIIKTECKYDNKKQNHADLAILDENNKLICIFEIYNTHKTEQRPEPWFELDADILIQNYENYEKYENYNNAELECIREFKCKKCKKKGKIYIYKSKRCWMWKNI